MKLNAAAATAALSVTTALVFAFNTTTASADGTPPPWAPGGTSQDANAVAGLKFFNAAGQQITSGSITAKPFAAYAVGLAQTRTGTFTDTTATLFGYVPQFGLTPDNWHNNEQIGLSTTFPNPSAPDPIKSTALPVNTGSTSDESLSDLAVDQPQTATQAGYVNAYEIRLYTSAPAHVASTTYDYTDITIDPVSGQWNQVFTPAGDFPPTGTTTPPTTPPTTPTTPPTTPTTPTTPPTTPTTPTTPPTTPTTPTTPPTTPTTPTTPPTTPTTPTTPPTTPTTPPTTPTTPTTPPTTPTTPTTPPTTPTTPTTPPTTPTTPPTTPTTPTTPPTTPTTPPTTPTTPTTPPTTPTTPTTPPTTPTTPVTSHSTTTSSSSGSVTAVDSLGNPLGSDPSLAPGSTALVTATGFAAHASVSITMHSTPISLGSRTATDSGSVSYTFTVPSDATPGAHHLVFASATKSMSFAFTVTGAPASASPTALSATGDDVVTPTALGFIALFLGAGLLYSLRQRVLYRGRHG